MTATPSPLGTVLLFAAIFAIGWGLELHGRRRDRDDFVTIRRMADLDRLHGIDPDRLQRSIADHPSNGGRS